MTIYLPDPYPDELLYSIIARYAAYANIRHIYTLKMNLLGGDSYLSPFLPRGLSIVSQRTWAVWHMNGQEIVRRFTMYPYYVSFIPSARKEQLMTGLLNPRLSIAVRYLVSRAMPNVLRYCHMCKKADLDEYGETYWRRSHQMKGVAVCPEHGEELIGVALQHMTTGAQFINPTEATSKGLKPEVIFDRREKQQLLAIARRCQSFLQEETDVAWANASPSLYRSIAFDKGLCSQRDGCRRQLIDIFTEMFSDRIIQTFELSGVLQNKSAWVSKILFSYTNAVFQPIAHAVIQEFLSTIPGAQTQAILPGLGPWQCPNSLGLHESAYPIKRVVIKVDQRQNPLALTTCCCGYSFEFYSTCPTNRSMPVVHRVTDYGPTWVREVRRLHDAGMSMAEISQALSIPKGSCRRLLKGGPKVGQSLSSLRQKWTTVLKRTEHHTVSEGHRLNPALYQQLKKTDPNFLTCSISRKRHPAQSDKEAKIKQHWQEKDARLSGRLRVAAESIQKEVPPVRVSMRAILRKSGISYWSIRKELKECCQLLQEAGETFERFQMRRLKYLAERAKAQGTMPTRNKLFYDGSIRLKKDKQRLAEYVDSLCVSMPQQKTEQL